MLVGESEPIVRDYARHFRSSIRHVIDFDYQSTPAFQTGWPSYVLVDGEGVIRLHVVGMRDNKIALGKALKEVARPEGEHAAATPPGVVCEGGICRIATPADGPRPVREQNPVLSAGADGSVWMAYASDADGDWNVYLRQVEGDGDAKPLRVTRSMADDYAPDLAVAVDGTVWVTWCSDRNDRYDVYARSLTDGKWSAEQRITTSIDDAMNPAIAMDGAGRTWITWYEWNKDFGTSRDRDVFARSCADGVWSDKVLVSPPEPAIEDHADPVIIADPTDPDRVWIAWSYDYHPSLFDEPEDADQPTIFACTVSADGSIGQPLHLVGTPGERLHAIDLWPSLAVDPDGTLWCAYDCAMFEIGRGALITSFDGERFTMPDRVTVGKTRFASPQLCIDKAGVKAMAWCEQVDGRWRIRGSRDDGTGFSEPRDLLESEGALRAPTLAADAEGFWLACEEQNGSEVKIRIERLKW